MPRRRWRSQGCKFSTPYEKLGRQLGAPKGLKTAYSEDDGGRYELYIYDYGGLIVEASHDRVSAIRANSSDHPTPSGLHVGMSRAKAVTILGREPESTLNKGWHWFHGCPEYKNGEMIRYPEIYFEFAFGEDGRIMGIRLILEAP